MVILLQPLTSKYLTKMNHLKLFDEIDIVQASPEASEAKQSHNQSNLNGIASSLCSSQCPPAT
jgi:hypothetical protein